MKCCHYERHLTDINCTFYSDQFILAKAQVFSLSFLSIEEESSPPRSTPWGAYRPATSYGAVPSSICLQSHAFTQFTHSYLIGRSMVVGHILMVHTYSLMCTNHIDMTAHTPAFFNKSGTTHIYVEQSTAGHSLISHLWSNARRMVTHPCINQGHDCLTSVIKCKAFTPC